MMFEKNGAEAEIKVFCKAERCGENGDELRCRYSDINRYWHGCEWAESKNGSQLCTNPEAMKDAIESLLKVKL